MWKKSVFEFNRAPKIDVNKSIFITIEKIDFWLPSLKLHCLRATLVQLRRVSNLIVSPFSQFRLFREIHVCGASCVRSRVFSRVLIFLSPQTWLNKLKKLFKSSPSSSSRGKSEPRNPPSRWDAPATSAWDSKLPVRPSTGPTSTRNARSPVTFRSEEESWQVIELKVFRIVMWSIVT